ncbi:MAG: carbohydrate ABC transporter permease [Pseudanabaenaceae cyanobacterium]
MSSQHSKPAANDGIWTIGLVLGALIWLSPLLYAAWISVHPNGGPWSLANYRQAWVQGHFLGAFANSFLVALTVTLSQTVTSVGAGYALARLPVPGRNLWLFLAIATIAVPLPLLAVPLFTVLKWGRAIDTYGALIWPTAASGYGIFWVRQAVQGIPLALEEAAALDGANRWQILRYVVLPALRPTLAVLALFAFLAEWNDLFKPLVFTTRPELQTVPLVLSSFQEQYTADWSLLMAAVTIATLPAIALFLVVQHQLVKGLATTGLKG